MKLAMIMLAAGNSRRFGSNKLLYEIDGKSMYLRCLETLMKVKEGNPDLAVTVVTQYDEIAETACRLGAAVVINPHPEEGISSSLKIGLTANQDADACLFTVSDQPHLTVETICGLIEYFRKSGRGMACVSNNGRPGNPCVFSKSYYPALMSLSGDTGGRKVIAAYPKDVALFEISEEKELEDVDFA